MEMKTTLLRFVLYAFLIVKVIAIEASDGLSMRAVVDKNEPGAIELRTPDGKIIFASRDAIVSAGHVANAKIVEGKFFGIQFSFTEAGQERLDVATRSMVGDQIAILIDGILIAVPTVHHEFWKGPHILQGLDRKWAMSVVNRTSPEAESEQGAAEQPATPQ